MSVPWASLFEGRLGRNPNKRVPRVFYAFYAFYKFYAFYEFFAFYKFFEFKSHLLKRD
jgi:hypothetical protein